jgi:hypothetical protein
VSLPSRPRPSPGAHPRRTQFVLRVLVVVVVFAVLAGFWYWRSLDDRLLGSLGEWVGGLGTVIAVVVAVGLARRDFAKRQAESLEAQQRTEALKISAWVTWSENSPNGEMSQGHFDSAPIGSGQTSAVGRDPRVVKVLNGSSSTVFDWTLVVVPSNHWDSYVRMSAAQGPLSPGELRSVPLCAPPPGVIVERFDKRSGDGYGLPRFVVLTFNDAWGNGWIRTNGDLQTSPQKSQFLPRLVHLRNPAMDWAGILDEATWRAFRQTVSNPEKLPKYFSEMLEEPERLWFSNEQVKELNEKISHQKRRRHFKRHADPYINGDRGIIRKVKYKDAFKDVRHFFKTVDGRTGSILYIKGDPGSKDASSNKASLPAAGDDASEQESLRTHL